MSLLPINNEPQNSGLGDTLKVAFDKVKANFIYLDEKFSGYVDLSTYNTQIDTLETSINNILIGYSQIGHTHVISDINNLQNSLNQLVKTTIYVADISAIQNEISSINTLLNTIIGLIGTPTIPTLQQVTDSGNTTTNPIITPQLILTNPLANNPSIISFDSEAVSITGPDSLSMFELSLGSLSLRNATFNYGQFNIIDLTQSRNYTFPDQSGTVALTSQLTDGDMTKAVYDTDNSGVVDNAETIQIIGRNSTGSVLRKGTIVYINGSTGNRPTFQRARANAEATSAGTFGVIAADIANNADGSCVAVGFLDNLDTRTNATYPFTVNTLADGDKLYLSPDNAGYVTNIKPSAPNHLVYIGTVIRTTPNFGYIVYRIQNGYELDEIHDCAISAKTNNDILAYESATSLWKNKSIPTVLGYTPYNSTNPNGYISGITSSNVTTALGYTPMDSRTDLVNRRMGYTVSTDLLSNNTAALSPYSFNAVLVGTLGTITGQIDANHPGVQIISSAAAAANSGGYITSHVATNTYSTIFTDGLQCDMIFKLPAVTTNNYFRFGHQYGTVTVALPTYGNYIEVSGTTLVGITRNNNVQSSTSTYNLTANVWYHSRIKETVVGGTNTFTFTIYDMAGTMLYNQSSTTNISTTITRALTILGVNTVSATALPIIYLDYIGMTFPAMVRGALN